jgi:hypothetical protein
MNHTQTWASPAPLWGRFDAQPGSAASAIAPDQQRPALLRFAQDEFIEHLLAMLAADPRQMGHLIARPETWRTPASEAPDLIERVPLPRLARALSRQANGQAAMTALAPTQFTAEAAENGVQRQLPLKLYHPAHQRHYLVAAQLVCERMGLPDHAPSSGEQIGFVLRRLLPRSSGAEGPPFDEYAFINGAGGAHWQRVAPDAAAHEPSATLADGEELLPLFPLTFRDDSGHPRRILAGSIPVGRREEYMSTRAQREAPSALSQAAGLSGAASVITARKEQFKQEVAEPWKNLIRSVYSASVRLHDESAGAAPSAALKLAAPGRANNQAQGQSWLLLLDMADYLNLHLKPVWRCVLNASVQNRQALKRPGQKALFDWIDTAMLPGGPGWSVGANNWPFAPTLREALKQISEANVRAGLEGMTRPFPEPADKGLSWPGFFSLLVGVDDTGQAWGVHETLKPLTDLVASDEDSDVNPPALSDIEAQALLIDKLVQLVVQAIDTDLPSAPTPPVSFAARLRDALASTPGDPGWFVTRCVFVRCDCAPARPAILSAPSTRFQLASFFDSDAPARPIRIALPLDTTAAGLRKHNKNTAFVISDVLCGQIQRAKGLGLGDLVRSVLPWPLHKDLDVNGMGPCQNAKSVNIGMICSLSIPIITLCALILLIIMVSLLDLIFRWMPWFVMCFPIPGLKAKR